MESLCDKINISLSFTPYQGISTFHPGRCAAIVYQNKRIGILGQLHPKFSKDRGLGTTVALEMDLTEILTDQKGFTYQSINKFPAITRDLAIVCQKDIPAEEISKLIKQTGKKTLTRVELFDVYTGDTIGIDEKSLAFKLVFEDSNKTLEAEEVDKLVGAILKRLDYVYKAKLR